MLVTDRTGRFALLLALALSGAAGAQDGQQTALPEPLTETIDSSTQDLLVPRVGEDRNLHAWSEYYASSLESEQYDQAVDAAEQMLEIAVDAMGDDSRLATNAALALAWAQRGAGDMLQAVNSYREAISMIESREGIFSPELVDPLIELGHAYHEGGEEQLAVDAMLRARHVTHRNQGLFNTDQMRIVDYLTELYFATGEIVDANREQNYAFRIVERDCNGVEVCMVDGIYKLAEWHVRTLRFASARKLYRRAIAAIEADAGPNDLRLVEALQGIASSYKKEGSRRKDGEVALRRAVDIYASQPYSDSVEHVKALAQLGDWHTLKGDYEKARTTYREAWEVLVAQGATPEQADAFFEQPAKLRYFPPTPTGADQAWRPSRIADSKMVVQFTVTAEGRVTGVRVVEADVSPRVQLQVREQVKRARYRPRLVNGEVVPTSGVRLVQDFDYVRNLPSSFVGSPLGQQTCRPPLCR
ncbi:MAG: TonB family protein [Pseudomonadota bacterium]